MAGITVHRRTSCRICGSTALRRWVHLPRMPLTDDFRKPSHFDDEFLHDIDVYRCSGCRVSQLLHDIDCGGYYAEYGFTVAGSPFAARFMERLADVTFLQYRLPNGCSVIEVGSGDGMQLSFFRDRGARVFGFEPSAVLCGMSLERGVPVHQGLFDADAPSHIPAARLPVDVLLLTYTFDHMPDPMGFLKVAREVLHPSRGVLVIEVHDLDVIMRRREYCLFEHEHSIYLSAATMRRTLQQAGLRLVATELLPAAERRANSLLVVAARDESPSGEQPDHAPVDFADDNWDTYADFNAAISRTIEALDEFTFRHVTAGKRIAGYGAGGRGVMTLASMDSSRHFAYLCDRNPRFHGRVTPKTHIPVVPPERLADDPVDVLLVFSFGYIDEIRRHITRLPRAPKELVSLLEVIE
jgi:hypothetical protein